MRIAFTFHQHRPGHLWIKLCRIAPIQSSRTRTSSSKMFQRGRQYAQLTCNNYYYDTSNYQHVRQCLWQIGLWSPFQTPRMLCHLVSQPQSDSVALYRTWMEGDSAMSSSVLGQVVHRHGSCKCQDGKSPKTGLKKESHLPASQGSSLEACQGFSLRANKVHQYSSECQPCTSTLETCSIKEQKRVVL